MTLKNPQTLRVALVHDWLVTHRGGEQVLLLLARLFPNAPIYTLVCNPRAIHPELRNRQIFTSFVQKLPGSPDKFRRYLPLFPLAIEQFDLQQFDLVISTSHCVAKGVKTRPEQLHVSYVHTPMRYVWDRMPEYTARLPTWAKPMAAAAAIPLRLWDVATAHRPDVIVANSKYVAARVQRVWKRRDAQVLYPPVDVDYFAKHEHSQRHGFVVVSALVPYKRVDLAVRWATEHGEPLIVVGDGGERQYLQRLAGPSVQFQQGVDREGLRALYAAAEGLLFCGVEDFGIVPVEAMAAGCPVIALGEGGALETVQGPKRAAATGVFFATADVAALHGAVLRLRSMWKAGQFSPKAMAQAMKRFDEQAFLQGFVGVLMTQTNDPKSWPKGASFAAALTKMSEFVHKANLIHLNT